MKRSWLLLGLLLTTLGCTAKDDEDAETGTVHVAIKPTGKPSSTSLVDAQVTDFKNTAIASGAPESMTIYIKSLALRTTDGVSRTIFYDTSGKGVRIGSKTVDISELFTDYACLNAAGVPVDGVGECPCGLDENNAAIAKNTDGTCPDSGNGGVGQVSVETGTFDTLQVEFMVGAKAKGCVTGDFGSPDNNGNAATQGVHTYCTKTAAHTFQTPPGVAAATELEGTLDGAEDMLFQINKYNGLYASATESFNMNFPINGSVTVEKDEENPPQITLMIDTNRMLRFYNQNKTQSPNPGMEENRSYFFSTVFEESTFVFVGSPGDIRGFQWWTEACSGNTSGTLCTGNNTSVVAGWMTIIKDSDQNPLLVGLMPDDDNSLTIIKGSNKTMDGINTSAFTASGASFDVSYALGSDGSGTIRAVNLDADLDSTQTSTFVGMQTYGGKIYLKREL